MTIPPKSTGNGSRSRAACLRWTPRHEQLETERQSQANHADRSAKTHHTGSAGTALVPLRRRIEFKLATLIYKTLHHHICQTSVSWCWTPIVVFAHRLHCQLSYHGPGLGCVTGRLMSPVRGRIWNKWPPLYV